MYYLALIVCRTLTCSAHCTTTQQRRTSCFHFWKQEVVLSIKHQTASAVTILVRRVSFIPTTLKSLPVWRPL